MRTLLAAHALLNDEWVERVAIEIAADGTIASVVPRSDNDAGLRLSGFVIPGMIDLHSHAFQRGLAGLAEDRRGSRSDFWSWRQRMYRFLEWLGPEEMWAIAAALYVDLLKSGYTSVVEFHYVHNRPDGGRYDNPGVMSVALHEAARETGIALTLLPVWYCRGGFDGQPLEGPQRRFGLSLDDYQSLLAGLEGLFGDDPDRRLGAAAHSLRAVPPERLGELVALVDALDPHAPLHIHLAEQSREVEECVARHGARPVELWSRQVEPGPRWCAVHATHIDEGERDLLAASGTIVGLCPSTEADLGDGLFPFAEYRAAGGRFGIGSDANLLCSPAEELRLLEYGQRLFRGRRTVASSEDEPHCGAALYRAALQGGAMASGRPVGRIAPGFRADLVHLDPEHPLLAGCRGDALLDGFIFASSPQSFVRDVMVGGMWKVREGEHADEHRVRRGLQQVRDRLGM